jgi:hypothetical protein
VIPVAPAREPADFDNQVRQPGLRAIAELCGKPPPNKRTAGRPFQKIQRTIDRLGLNDFRRDREEDAERYWSRDVSLRVLRQESPFVAEELRRQGRLHRGEIW